MPRGMFEYECKDCEVTGWTSLWPPRARCWQCGGSDLVPASFKKGAMT